MQAAKKYQIFIAALYIISISLILFFLIDGISFYFTPYNLRPRHDEYRQLRPAGDTGHAFGIIGSAMMLFMLLYSLRKRTAVFKKWGHLSHWLDIHIYFGIVGPLLVILHTSFKVQGLVAVSFWSMITVALSGILGRYLYLQIPRNFDGDELTDSELKNTYSRMTDDLSKTAPIDDKILATIESEIMPPPPTTVGLFGAVWFIFIDDISRRFRGGKIIPKYSSLLKLPPNKVRQLTNLIKKRALLRRKIHFINQVQQLFHYWHVFHKPFAIIMYIVMLVHVSIAFWLGYTWIF